MLHARKLNPPFGTHPDQWLEWDVALGLLRDSVPMQLHNASEGNQKESHMGSGACLSLNAVTCVSICWIDSFRPCPLSSCQCKRIGGEVIKSRLTMLGITFFSVVLGFALFHGASSDYVADLSILAFTGTPVGKVIPFDGRK